MFPLVDVSVPASQSVDGVELWALADADLHAEVHARAARYAQAGRDLVAAVAVWDERMVWLSKRCAEAATHLSVEAGLNRDDAAAKVRLVRNLRHCPLFAAAFYDGRVGEAKATLLARFAAKPRISHQLAGVEAEVLDGCLTLTTEQTRAYLAVWEAVLDPDGPDPESRRRHRRAGLRWLEDDHLRLGADLFGEEAHEFAAVHKALFDKLAQQAKDKDPAAVPGPEQLAADALMMMARLARATPHDATPQRASLTVEIRLETLEAKVPGGLPAVVNGTGFLPSEAARRLACDCELHPHIVDALGRTIAWGETERLANRATRRYVVARDKGCRFPGCNAPPSWCVLHHIHHWTDGGRTDHPNLALVCPHHHRMLHEGGWRLRRRDDGDLDLISPAGEIEVLPGHVGTYPGPPPRIEPEPEPPPRPDEIAATWHTHRFVLAT